MADDREVCVHLLPDLVAPERLRGSLAVVIDVLRSTTTMVHALAAGLKTILPAAEVEEARELAGGLRVGRGLLGGERGGEKLLDFDTGNSPREYTPELCRGNTLVLTTSNGTRALLWAAEADRVLVAAFVNFSAVCEQLGRDERPVHLLCAGTSREVALEDALLAGAFVEFLCEVGPVRLNDGARLAWDCYEHHGACLLGAIRLSQGGKHLTGLGYEQDIKDAAQVDRFALVPELRRNPFRVEIGSVGFGKSHWMK